MLDTTTTLPDGVRVRVRLPHASDRPGLRALHAHLGFEVGELELARALRFDPRRRVVACVTAWDGTAERLVGYGAIDLGADDVDLLVVDATRAPGAAELLRGGLRTRAQGSRAAA